MIRRRLSRDADAFLNRDHLHIHDVLASFSRGSGGLLRQSTSRKRAFLSSRKQAAGRHGRGLRASRSETALAILEIIPHDKLRVMMPSQATVPLLAATPGHPLCSIRMAETISLFGPRRSAVRTHLARTCVYFWVRTYPKTVFEQVKNLLTISEQLPRENVSEVSRAHMTSRKSCGIGLYYCAT